MRDLQLFDRSVEAFFEPIARRLGLPLSKVQGGVYEVASPYIIMRIRLHTGHHRGLNVMLRPASSRVFNESEPGAEYGLVHFVLLEGGDWTEPLIATDADFLNWAAQLAIQSERFGAPYLLGKGKNYDAVKEIVRQKSRRALEEIKAYRFPKNVRKEWI